jgi:hypothetical protein
LVLPRHCGRYRASLDPVCRIRVDHHFLAGIPL